MQMQTNMKAPCAIKVNWAKHTVSQRKNRFSLQGQTKVAICDTDAETLYSARLSIARSQDAQVFQDFAAIKIATWHSSNCNIQLCAILVVGVRR